MEDSPKYNNEVVVDGDSLKYIAGCLETRHSMYLKTGTVVSCRDRDLFKDELKIQQDRGEIIQSTGKDKVYPPLSFQYQKLNTKLRYIKKMTKADKLTIWLSPGRNSLKENFRLGVASIQPYKGNRMFYQKSPFDKDLHQYLMEEWGAMEAIGQEADDACGIAAMEGKLVACIDKDVLYNIPGKKFNYNTGEWFDISEEDSWYNFFKQVLTGDTGDNIPGIYRMGPKKAEEALNKTVKAPQQLYSRVVEVYKQYYKGEHPKRLSKIIHENATLLWIRRKPGDNYSDYVEII